MHRWFALGLLRSRPSDSSNDLQQGELPQSSHINRLQYFTKECISVFFYFFTSLTNGYIETEVEDNDSTSNIYVEKKIVVAMSVFLFFYFGFVRRKYSSRVCELPDGSRVSTY